MALATLKQQRDTGKWIAEFNGQVLCKSSSREYVIQSVTTGRCEKAKKLNVNGFVNVDAVAGDVKAAVQEEVRVDINKRFEFLENFTQMIIDGSINSLIVTGEGGLGKTYTIFKKIQDAKLEDVRSFGDAVRAALEDMYSDDPEGLELPGDYIAIKGYSTPKALYRSLYENRNKIVIFDDCDRVLKDEVAINILKGALDSYSKRLICWNAEMSKDDKLPRSFEFQGQVIFVSNMEQWKLDQALKSRSLRVDLSMTAEEKIKRMKHLLNSLELNVKATAEHRKDAMEFLTKNKDRATDLNIRTLMNVITIRATHTKKDWEEMALYTITA